LLGATALGLFVCGWLIEPFLPALTWALALAVLFTPLQRWLEAKLPHPGWAAIVSVVLIALIVVVPVTFVGQRLVQQAAEGAELVGAKLKSGEWQKALETQPRLMAFAAWTDRQINLPATVQSLAAWLSTTAGAVVKGSVFQLIGFCLTFYLLFFFLRDRPAVLALLRSLSPLTDVEMDRLFRQVGDTIFATVYGTLAVSFLQGLMGGLMFWWLGLPAAMLWGVIMALLAIVPVLGAFVIWIPAAIYLAAEGSWGKALILTLWGLLVVGTIDNLLRPILMGNRLKIHTALSFMSVVGGLMLFGPAGLILGPVVLATTMALLEVWRSRASPEQAEPR
jgi:predicted PurR-regulated permease PerM